MRLRLLLAFAGLFLAAGAAYAHSLWVDADGNTVKVVFEHSMRPGEGGYNETILAKGKTYVRTPAGKERTELTLRETGAEGARYFEARTSAQAPRSIEHSCVFGLYQGRLDYFYGKHLDVKTADELAKLAKAPDHPWDLVPSVEGEALRIRVEWQGKPMPNHAIAVIEPDGTESKKRTNRDGVLVFRPTQKGLYGFWAVRLDDEPKGTHEGQRYDGTMHGGTVSLHWPLGD